MSLYHGLEENRKITVENGRVVYKKRVKYCAVHSWIDLFVCGGLDDWQRAHGRCGGIAKEAGAGLKLPKTTAAAA